jgi:hypothetical protein
MKNLKLRSHFLYTLLVAVLFTSCSEIGTKSSETYDDGEYKTFSSMLNQCKGETVVVAISQLDGSLSYAKINIVVVDSTNKSYSCRIGGDLGLKIGDTVKFSKNSH